MAAALLERGASVVIALDIDRGTLAEGLCMDRLQELSRVCGDGARLPPRDATVLNPAFVVEQPFDPNVYDD